MEPRNGVSGLSSTPAAQFGRREMLKRGAIFGLGTSALGALLAACGSSSGGAATQAAAAQVVATQAAGAAARPTTAATAVERAGSPVVTAPKDAVTLQFWSRFDFLKEAIDLYNADAAQAGKKIFISFTTVPANQMVEKLTAALSSKTQPDVMSLDLVQCPYFNSLNTFVDISTRFNALSYKGEFAAAPLQLGGYQGKQYQLPFAADNSALLWNKDHFREAGLDPEKAPANWNEFRDFAIKTTKGDRFGLAFDAQTGGTFMFRWLPFVWANGGDILNAEGTKSTINSPEALEALQLWVDLIQKDKVTPPGTHTFSGDDLRAAFQAGKIAMMINGNAIIAQMNRDAPNLNYGTAFIPAPPKTGKHASFAGGDLTGILSGTKYEEQSWDLVQYLTSQKVQVEYFAKRGVIPIRTPFYKNQYFDQEPRYQTFARNLEVARTPYTLKYNRLYDALQANLQAALAGTKTPQQALSEIESAHNKVLAG